jgi:hypothetical protein
MGKQTHSQHANDLMKEAAKLRIQKANEELAEVLKKHKVGLQAQLRYSDGGIMPVVLIVDRPEQPNANGKTETGV